MVILLLQLHYYKQGKHSDFEALLKAANAGECLFVYGFVILYMFAWLKVIGNYNLPNMLSSFTNNISNFCVLVYINF